MHKIVKFFIALSASFSFIQASDIFTTALQYAGITSDGSWLKEVVILSSSDMNFVEKVPATDSGPNSVHAAVVFCNDEKLKEELKKIPGTAFFAQANDLMNKHANNLYVVDFFISPGSRVTIDLTPKDNNIRGKQVYDSCKFVLLYAEYHVQDAQLPGATKDSFVYDLSKDQTSQTLVFGRSAAQIQQQQ